MTMEMVRQVFFAFTAIFGLFRCILLLLLYSIVTVIASRSLSHCIRFYEKGCFSVMFFYELFFLLLLFSRRQNSYLLFECLVECQQEGVSKTFVFSFSFCIYSKNYNSLSFDSVHFFNLLALYSCCFLFQTQHQNSFSECMFR